MWCDSQFRKFDEKIKLDATRRERIESALSAFDTFVRSDKELSAASAGAPFLQGSVATRTAIRPLTGDEFDVDVIYPFRLTAFSPQPTPKEIIKWFLARLAENKSYKGHLIPKDRCARIDYAGDFHVDIIPSTPDLSAHQPYAVPTRDLGSWKTNNPKGFASWVNQRNVSGGGFDLAGDGYFLRSVRMMKRWRDQVFSSEAAPSSMLLVTFLGNHDPTVSGYSPALEGSLFPRFQHDAAYLYDLLRLTHSCLVETRDQSFENPSVAGEDLAGSWRYDHLAEFLVRLKKCINHLEQAILATTDEAAIQHYRRAFGDTFPSA